MPDEPKDTPPPKRTREDTQFKKGMPRPPGAGWKAGTRGRIAQMRDYCAAQCKAAGAPFKSLPEMLMYIAIHGRDPLEAKINEELGEKSPFHPSKVNIVDDETGKVVRIKGFVGLDLRVDCARLAMPYMYNRLHSIEHTGEDGGPIKSEAGVVATLSRDPEIRSLLEKVADKASQIENEEGAPEDGE